MLRQDYVPPPGPPPGHRDHEAYAPPPGTPPGYQAQQGGYVAPPGPPPSHRQQQDQYAPPPGPPPSHGQAGYVSAPAMEAPPPGYQQHDWQSAVPDTSTYSPPPAISNDFSPTANASWDDAQRGAAWCHANPLWPAQKLSSQITADIHKQKFNLAVRPPFVGEVRSLGQGYNAIKSPSTQVDALLQPDLPIYAALTDSPMVTEKTRTIYFEVKVKSLGAPQQRRHRFSRNADEVDAGIALGFFAPPYPPFRLPGWQRGSLGVHSDDGRRYINDTHGGIDFTEPFKAGQTVGLGMTFSVPSGPPPTCGGGKPGSQLKVEVFFTQDGKRTGSWDLHEERDELDKNVQGLEGDFDIFAGVGVFGPSEFEVVFDEQHWLYRL